MTICTECERLKRELEYATIVEVETEGQLHTAAFDGSGRFAALKDQLAAAKPGTDRAKRALLEHQASHSSQN